MTHNQTRNQDSAPSVAETTGEEVVAVEVQEAVPVLEWVRSLSRPENKQRPADYQDVTTEARVRPISW